MDTFVHGSLQQSTKTTAKSLYNRELEEINRGLCSIYPETTAPASTCYFRFCLFLPFPLPLPLPLSSSAKRTCFPEEAPRALERPEERDDGRRLPCRDPELDLPLDCWRLLSFFSGFFAALFGVGVLLLDVGLEEEAGTIFSLCFSISSALFCARKAKALSSFNVIGFAT